MEINIKIIKKIYMNLETEKEKRNNTEYIFKKLNYNNFERFNSILDRSYPSSGCSLSHREVIEKYKSEYPIAIFEDDNCMCDWYHEYIPETGILNIPDDCDMFYLGYSIAKGVESPGPRPLSFSFMQNKLIKLKGSLSAHAIIFFTERAKEEAVKAINSCILKKIPGDVGYYDMMSKLNVYSFDSALFYQKGVNCKYTNVRLINNNLKEYKVYSEQNKILTTGKI